MLMCLNFPAPFRLAMAKAADESAVGLIEQTMAVLNKFYEDNGLALAQIASKASQSETQEMSQAPGEAPPPPPSCR